MPESEDDPAGNRILALPTSASRPPASGAAYLAFFLKQSE